jgi:murein DD-endopeptidase MepM/ murein hydrolase activator NlpD
MPTSGRIVSPFGYRLHPVHKYHEFHEGIDIAGKPYTPVYTTADGRVVFAGWEHGYGLLVIIKHDFDFYTYYAHLKKIAVKKNQRVKRGEIIGYMGSTGTTTGTHLHYEVRKRGKALNPYYYLTPQGFYKKEMKKYVWKIKR